MVLKFRLIELNFKTLLDQLPSGNQFYIYGNGRVRKRQNDQGQSGTGEIRKRDDNGVDGPTGAVGNNMESSWSAEV